MLTQIVASSTLVGLGIVAFLKGQRRDVAWGCYLSAIGCLLLLQTFWPQ